MWLCWKGWGPLTQGPMAVLSCSPHFSLLHSLSLGIKTNSQSGTGFRKKKKINDLFSWSEQEVL